MTTAFSTAYKRMGLQGGYSCVHLLVILVHEVGLEGYHTGLNSFLVKPAVEVERLVRNHILEAEATAAWQRDVRLVRLPRRRGGRVDSCKVFGLVAEVPSVTRRSQADRQSASLVASPPSRDLSPAGRSGVSSAGRKHPHSHGHRLPCVQPPRTALQDFFSPRSTPTSDASCCCLRLWASPHRPSCHRGSADPHWHRTRAGPGDVYAWHCRVRPAQPWPVVA